MRKCRLLYSNQKLEAGIAYHLFQFMTEASPTVEWTQHILTLPLECVSPQNTLSSFFIRVGSDYWAWGFGLQKGNPVFTLGDAQSDSAIHVMIVQLVTFDVHNWFFLQDFKTCPYFCLTDCFTLMTGSISIPVNPCAVSLGYHIAHVFLWHGRRTFGPLCLCHCQINPFNNIPPHLSLQTVLSFALAPNTLTTHPDRDIYHQLTTQSAHLLDRVIVI